MNEKPIKAAAEEYWQDTANLLQEIRQSKYLTVQGKRDIVARLKTAIDRLQTNFAKWAADDITSKIQGIPSAEIQVANVTFLELTSVQQLYAMCAYGVVRDGNHLARCGEPATIIQRITYSDGNIEDRFYCAEHARIERAIPT